MDDRGQGSELTEASLNWDRACCDRTNLPEGSLGPSRFLVSSAIHSTHSAGSCDNCPVEGQMVCVLTTMNRQRRPFSLPYMLLPPLFVLVLCPLPLQVPKPLSPAIRVIYLFLRNVMHLYSQRTEKQFHLQLGFYERPLVLVSQEEPCPGPHSPITLLRICSSFPSSSSHSHTSLSRTRAAPSPRMWSRCMGTDHHLVQRRCITPRESMLCGISLYLLNDVIHVLPHTGSSEMGQNHPSGRGAMVLDNLLTYEFSYMVPISPLHKLPSGEQS